MISGSPRLERLRDFSIERCDRSEKSQRCRLNSRNLSKRARNHNNPSNFLKNHNFFILDPIFDPKIDLEFSAKIDFTYDTFKAIKQTVIGRALQLHHLTRKASSWSVRCFS